MFRVATLLAIAIALTSPVIAQDQNTRQFAVRYMLKDGVKELFDSMIASLKPEATEQQRRDATDATKFLLYNKAYGTYVCWVSSYPNKVEILDSEQKNIEECTKKFMEQLSRVWGLSTDYGRLIGNERAAKCEMRTRLFRAEAEFPPYDFLEGPMSHLFDLAKLNECLTAN